MVKEVALTKLFMYFWQAPHRSLFLACYLCAFATVAYWPLGAGLGLPPPLFQLIQIWHVHELLFGFAGAALGGYLLTALPSWTGGDLLAGGRLKVLVLLWGLARLTAGLAEALPLAVVVAGSCGYFLYLAALMLPQLLGKRTYRKLGFVAFVLGLGSLDVLFVMMVLKGEVWIGFGLARGVVIGFAGLMIVVGGRAVPAFSRNWLLRSGRSELVREGEWARQVVLALLGAVLGFSWLGWHGEMLATCLAAGLTLLWSMRGWHGHLVLRNPLLAALHLGYLWLPLGLVGIGVTGLLGDVCPVPLLSLTDALHALTIGAMAGLIMAISGRAAAHHSSGSMQATKGFTLGFALIWICTWLRLGAAFVPDHGAVLIDLAAGVWCLGWLAFIIGFLPALYGPVHRPVLSGKRHPDLTKARN